MDALDRYIEDSEANYLHVSEIANILKELDSEEFDYYINKLPPRILGELSLELPQRYYDDIITQMPVDTLAVAAKGLESDDQTDFLQELEEIDQAKAKQVFQRLDRDDQANVTRLKEYGEDVAGAYMQTELFEASLEETVGDTIERFKQLKQEKKLENVHNLFLTHYGKLIYVVALEDLLTYDFDKRFDELVDLHSSRGYQYAVDTEDIDRVVKKFEEYDLPVMPVLDSSGTLIGRITLDDVYDIISDQATEQMYHLAGVDDEAEEDEDIFNAGKKRSIWLVVNLFTAIAASLVIGLFESTLQSYVALAVLMPIVASMGGNAGTQSLTVVVRQLALGNISATNAYSSIKKEIAVSLLNGMLFAVLMGLVAYAWFGVAMLGVVIGLSMIINLFAAGLFGSVVPLALKKLNVDPAIGSTVVLTTVTDIVGFFSFLGLATIILL
ncbi:MAG: magnesium transporter [Campylobacterota bacterium]